jgi:hypothetical protein
MVWTTESVKPGIYTLQSFHKESEFQSFPGYLASGTGVPGRDVDIESDLKDIYPVSKCKTYNLCKCDPCIPGCKCGCKCDVNNVVKESTSQFNPEFTRVNKGCNESSVYQPNRLEALCVNVQREDRIQSNSYIGRDTRFEMKDLAKPILKKPCNCPKKSGPHIFIDCVYE